MRNNIKKDYIKIISLGVGISRDDVEEYTNSIKLQLLADIIRHTNYENFNSYVVKQFKDIKKRMS